MTTRYEVLFETIDGITEQVVDSCGIPESSVSKDEMVELAKAQFFREDLPPLFAVHVTETKRILSFSPPTTAGGQPILRRET